MSETSSDLMKQVKKWEKDSEILERAGWPPSLVDACADLFDYAMGLRDGSVIRFSSARVGKSGEWVHLPDNDGFSLQMWREGKDVGYPFERGIDVRVADIIWCCKAPEGS